MDKTKFTVNPHLDSEGFPWAVEDMQTASSWLQLHNEMHRFYAEFIRLADQLPTVQEAWDNLLGCVTLDPSEYERKVDEEHDATEVKKAVAEFFLNGPVQTFDGEKGTYFDPKCAICSPWSDFFTPLAAAQEAAMQHMGVHSKRWDCTVTCINAEPDVKCATCSPWEKIEQRDLDRIHQLWLAERITPNGGTR